MPTVSTAGIEPALIRIDKGEDSDRIWGREPLSEIPGKTANPANIDHRQAVQPLTSSVRINSRTPGSQIRYRTRQTTDNVGRLIWRNNPGNIPNRLPNLGNQLVDDWASYDSVRNRPQSGNAVTPTPGNGLNLWQPMGPYTNGLVLYNSAFTIGGNNYNDGGMIVHIEAQASLSGVTSVTSLEAAYRSVLVFNNVSINGNYFQLAGLGDVGRTDVGSGGKNNDAGIGMMRVFDNIHRGRMWVRGGNTTQGAPTVPDFPINRNHDDWRMTRLLTPIEVSSSGVLLGGANFNNLANAASALITNAHIPDVYRPGGDYLWFWVTWRINVNAYIDLYAGELPDASDPSQTPVRRKSMGSGWVMATEHYPVIPGRTTVLETRQGVFDQWAGGGYGAVGFLNILPVR